MADAAAARREARRRRILENSHNRLQLISGKSTEDCSRGSPIRTTVADQDSHRFCINNGVIVTEQESLDSIPSIPLITSLTSDVPVSEGEVVNDLAFSAPRAQELVKHRCWRKSWHTSMT
ncbi:uncharacterized protein LOC119191088 [Manduca sexta]|uniref:uncharacterized protein LOC119191088 n=1 Tax=Manduca sexta TaxID=7130 RepID=UPI00188F4A35|nr:uncharacterized protein LOC119191088 [Manduca sexta]